MAYRKRSRRVQTVTCSTPDGVNWYFRVGDTEYGWNSLTLTLWLAGDDKQAQWGPDCPTLDFAVGYAVGFEAHAMLGEAARRNGRL